MIEAKIIKDSVANGVRLTTLQLRYPRFIHSEFMTHRVFSRNASSSRAIPVSRMIKDILRHPAMPIHWGKNQRGMQASEEKKPAWVLWYLAMYCAVTVAWVLNKLGYHKQVVNRLLEPFQHINVVVTSTEWDNFFKLRIHPDAQPEICELAYQIRCAMRNSVPEALAGGMWHLPYILEGERKEWPLHVLKEVSAARCASVSYKTVDGRQMTVKKAREIYNKLNTDPLHASAFEHIASPALDGQDTRNFRGWKQWRVDIENSNLRRT